MNGCFLQPIRLHFKTIRFFLKMINVRFDFMTQNFKVRFRRVLTMPVQNTHHTSLFINALIQLSIASTLNAQRGKLNSLR